MPNPENLTPWKPGQSGNPKGTTQARRVSAALAKLLEDKNLDGTLAMTIFAAAIGDPKLLNGRKPDARFMQMLLDRVEGKVPDRVITQGEEPPKRINVPEKDERPGEVDESGRPPEAGD